MLTQIFNSLKHGAEAQYSHTVQLIIIVGGVKEKRNSTNS